MKCYTELKMDKTRKITFLCIHKNWTYIARNSWESGMLIFTFIAPNNNKELQF